MTAEHAVYLVRAAGAELHAEGDRLILTAPSQEVRNAIPPEAIEVLRSRKDEVLAIVRRLQARGPVPIRCLCAACEASFPWPSPGMDWLPTPSGGYWPRCPTCATRGRVPAPPGTPRPRRRGSP